MQDLVFGLSYDIGQRSHMEDQHVLVKDFDAILDSMRDGMTYSLDLNSSSLAARLDPPERRAVSSAFVVTKIPNNTFSALPFSRILIVLMCSRPERVRRPRRQDGWPAL